MSPAEIIRKKRFGELSKEEIEGFIGEYADRCSLPDYQMAAMAMAICFQGMTAEETAI